MLTHMQATSVQKPSASSLQLLPIIGGPREEPGCPGEPRIDRGAQLLFVPLGLLAPLWNLLGYPGPQSRYWAPIALLK